MTQSDRQAQRATAAKRRKLRRLLLQLGCLLAVLLSTSSLTISLTQLHRAHLLTKQSAAARAATEAAESSTASIVEVTAGAAAPALTEPQSEDSTGEASSAEAASAQEAAPEEPLKDASVTISFAGDCTLSSYYGEVSSNTIESNYLQYGEDYFFKNVADIFASDDLTVTNLECTLTGSTDRVYKTFNFKADPSYVGILTAGDIECVNLANNHTHDYSDSGYQETTETLDAAGISWFAGGDTCLIEVNDILIGFSGIYECESGLACMDQAVANVEALREAGAEIVVCQFHWGDENSYCPNSKAVTLAHAVIDAGADLVIGHHPHVLQGIELYQGKYICYSLGNFCFGGNPEVNDKDTMIVEATFSIRDGALLPMEYELIPCSISTESTENTYCPTPAEGEEAERILEKIYKCCGYIDGGITREAAQSAPDGEQQPEE